MKVEELKNIELCDIARNYMDILIDYQQDCSETIKKNRLISQEIEYLTRLYEDKKGFIIMFVTYIFCALILPLLISLIDGEISISIIWSSYSMIWVLYFTISTLFIIGINKTQIEREKKQIDNLKDDFQIIPKINLTENELKFLNDELKEQKETIKKYSIIKKHNHRYIIDNNHAIDVTDITTQKDDELLKVIFYHIAIEKKSYSDNLPYEYDDIRVEEIEKYTSC